MMIYRTAQSTGRTLCFVVVLMGFICGCREESTDSPTEATERNTNQSAIEQPGPVEPEQFQRQDPFVLRPLDLIREETWIGRGVGYGPYRNEQRPGGVEIPSEDQITEDLELMTPHWGLLRLYGSVENAETILQIIHKRKFPFRVMLGAWITNEKLRDEQGQPDLDNKAGISTNQREVRAAIRLANAYPDEVMAVSVGNETQVFWSDHLTQSEVLIRYIREVRAKTRVPVTTADDFKFWTTPESKLVAEELDFIATHIHPMWAGLSSSTAMSWTERIYAEVCESHPQKTVAIGESGWATQVHNEGEQAKMIKGKAGEEEQRMYYQQFTDWANKQKICTFYFEAFDETWKGGPHPDEVEKHWGLFRANRTPKTALTVKPLMNADRR